MALSGRIGSDMCVNCGGPILDFKAKDRDDFLGMCQTCENKVLKGDKNFVSIQDRIKYRKQREGQVKRYKFKLPMLKRRG